jgi:hypothetical protein
MPVTFLGPKPPLNKDCAVDSVHRPDTVVHIHNISYIGIIDNKTIN